jgi:hypothetical protein
MTMTNNERWALRVFMFLVFFIVILCIVLAVSGFAQPIKDTQRRITTQNVMATPLMSQSHVLHDVYLTAHESSVIGWQEMWPTRYKRAIRSLPGWSTAAFSTSNPISWRDSVWRLVASGRVLLHPAVRNVKAATYGTWVKLRLRGTGQTWLVNNAHYIAHAWSHRWHWRDTWAIRQRIWLETNRVHRALIAHWIRQGLGVLGTGDFNRVGYRTFGRTLANKAVHYPVGFHQLDVLTIINGALTFTVHSTARLGGRYSDHPGRRMNLTAR